jgi:hypothetical protein
MEKSSAEFTKKRRGLLTGIFLFALIFFTRNFLNAKTVSWNYLASLKFRQTQERIFTDAENSFCVEIEGVSPESVQVAVNSLPQGASFVSYKKETVVMSADEKNFSSGTRITIWMNFSRAGFYNIRPVDLVIGGNFYQVPFEAVEVFENPRFVQPEVKIIFSDEKFQQKKFEAQEGDHIIFSVAVRYAAEIFDVTWNIPRDSVFKKISGFDEKFSVSKNSYSAEFLPVAVFDWQPLKSGETEFPEIFVSASSYNGTKFSVKCNAQKFKILRGEKKSAEKKNPSIFSYAFIQDEKPAEEKNFADEKSVEKIFDLHCRERHSLPFSKAAAERKKLEAQLELPAEKNEPSLILFRGGIFFALIFALAAIAGIFLHRKKFAFFALVIFASSAVFLFVYGFRLNEKRGIFAGGKMNPIPEKNLQSGVTVPGGSVVMILRTAGGWMYIRYNDTCGWVDSRNVHLIK